MELGNMRKINALPSHGRNSRLKLGVGGERPPKILTTPTWSGVSDEFEKGEWESGSWLKCYRFFLFLVIFSRFYWINFFFHFLCNLKIISRDLKLCLFFNNFTSYDCYPGDRTNKALYANILKVVSLAALIFVPFDISIIKYFLVLGSRTLDFLRSTFTFLVAFLFFSGFYFSSHSLRAHASKTESSELCIITYLLDILPLFLTMARSSSV